MPLEPEVLDFLATSAKKRGTTINQLVNQLLKKDIELIQDAANFQRFSYNQFRPCGSQLSIDDEFKLKSLCIFLFLIAKWVGFVEKFGVNGLLYRANCIVKNYR